MHTKVRIFSIKLLIILLLMDFSADYVLQQLFNFVALINPQIRVAITLLLAFCAMQGICDFFRLKSINYSSLYSFGVVAIVLLYGLCYGLLENNPQQAMREGMCMLPLLLVPSFLLMTQPEKEVMARFFCNFLIIVCLVKMTVSQCGAIFFRGVPSWKIYLKFAPLLVLPYTYYLLRILNKKATKNDVFVMLIIIIEVLVTQARALTLTVGIITLGFIFLKLSIKRIIQFMTVSVVAILLATLITGSELKYSLGHWSDKNYDDTAAYRIEQMDIIMDRVIARPVRGVGFGYVTQGYKIYEQLDLSYLLEMDLLNFASKVGLPLFLLYLSAYLPFMFRYRKLWRYQEVDKNLYCAMTVSMFGMLFYSCFQTNHSSVVYWFLFALSFGVLLSNNQKGYFGASEKFYPHEDRIGANHSS